MKHTAVIDSINIQANPARAEKSMRFFRTGKGQYSDGDVFLGLTVPEQRRIAKQYADISLSECTKLLQSKYHEHRLVALLILVSKFQTGDTTTKQRVLDVYLSQTQWVNNWDLVDTSAYHILGAWIFEHPKDITILTKLARSQDLWEKRIAIVSTLTLIRQGETQETMRLSKILLHDSHDLIHKAVGWMLREVGKKSYKTLVLFLDEHAHDMPRTMLRYAIEKFPKETRQYYLLYKKK